MIHNNGGTPFCVKKSGSIVNIFEINHKKAKKDNYPEIEVVRNGHKNTETPEKYFDRKVLEIKNVRKIWIDKESSAPGASILGELKEEGVFFLIYGSRIIQFMINGKCIGFRAPIYGSDMPYPVFETDTHIIVPDTNIVRLSKNIKGIPLPLRDVKKFWDWYHAHIQPETFFEVLYETT